jgi:hypothetical protein
MSSVTSSSLLVGKSHIAAVTNTVVTLPYSILSRKSNEMVTTRPYKWQGDDELNGKEQTDVEAFKDKAFQATSQTRIPGFTWQ